MNTRFRGLLDLPRSFMTSVSFLTLSLALAACSHPPKLPPGPAPMKWDGSPVSMEDAKSLSVAGTRGMVVADDREAAEWGVEILRKGGNAMDAAVATAFAMSVTRPHFAALGGGGFMVYCPAPKNQTPSDCQVVDFREMAPGSASRDMYIRNGKPDTHLSQDGALASGVPGVPAGLLLGLDKFGSMPRQKLLTRPIELARKGYRMSTNTEKVAYIRWKEMNDEAKRIFGCDGKPCPVGSLIKQTDLAKVLEAISKEGRKGFYEGWVAKKLVEGIRAGGGIFQLSDLANYTAKLRTPVKSRFAGMEVVTMPPPSSGGIVLLQILNFLEMANQQGYLVHGAGSVPSIHATAHAMSLAFADRAEYMGDPDFVKVPADKLLSEGYLTERWKTFNPAKMSLPDGPGQVDEPKHLHTTHFSTIDREGNAVAMTLTVNDYFGSGFVPPGTGVVMNNQMDDFSISPGTPNLFGLIGKEANAIAPGKRPLSSMSPTIVRDDQGNVRLVLGAEGGPRIITSVLHTIVNRLVYGMSLADAVTAPRFHQQWRPVTLKVERFAFPAEIRGGLTELGYKLDDAHALGFVHALERFPNGRTWGAADPRAEGAAVAE